MGQYFFLFNVVVLLSWNQVHLHTHWNHTHDQNRVKNCIFVSCNDCSLILVAFYFIFCSIFLRISSCITPQLRAKFIRQLTMIACAAKFFLFFCILALFFLVAKFENLRSIQLKFMKRESRVVFLRGGEREVKKRYFLIIMPHCFENWNFQRLRKQSVHHRL